MILVVADADTVHQAPFTGTLRTLDPFAELIRLAAEHGGILGSTTSTVDTSSGTETFRISLLGDGNVVTYRLDPAL